MKKICLLVFCLTFVFIFCNSLQSFSVFANNTNQQFARVLKSGVKLYRNPIETEEYSNVYFLIPKTYFVELLESSNDLFYKAKYMNVDGYVRKSDVRCIAGVPKTPYANKIGFRIFSLGGLNLRDEPGISRGIFSVVETIPYLCIDLQFFGEIEGEQAVPKKGTTWYYCRYIKGSMEFYGYVYSEFCDEKTEIEDNKEVFEYITEPNFSTIPAGNENIKPNDGLNFSDFSTLKQALIIVAVCVPCFVIVYLLFKPTKITVNALDNDGKKTFKSKKIKRKRGQDYYEYD